MQWLDLKLINVLMMPGDVISAWDQKVLRTYLVLKVSAKPNTNSRRPHSKDLPTQTITLETWCMNTNLKRTFVWNSYDVMAEQTQMVTLSPQKTIARKIMIFCQKQITPKEKRSDLLDY